jgi:hypothetical protein
MAITFDVLFRRRQQPRYEVAGHANITQLLGKHCLYCKPSFSGISRRSAAQPDNAFDLANGFIGSAVTRASIIDPGRKSHGPRHPFSVGGKNFAGVSQTDELVVPETLRTSRQILISLELLTIFSGESLANNRLAAGKRSTGS